MIKKILYKLTLILVAIGILMSTNFAFAQVSTQGGGTGTTSPSGILYGDGTLHLKTLNIGSNLTFTGGTLSATGGGGSSTFGTTSLSALWPLIYTVTNSLAQFSFGGLGTTTNLVVGHVPYVTGVNTFSDEATGTITCAGTASCGAGSYVLGSNLVITGSAGSSASSTLLTDTNTFSGPTNFNATVTFGSFAPVTINNTLFAAALRLTGVTGATKILFANSVGAVFGMTSLPISFGGTGLTSIGASSTFLTSDGTSASWETLPPMSSSTLLTDTNTFSGVNLFTNASSDFSGTWQTFSPSHFQTALGFTPVPNTRNINTTYPLAGGGALSADLTLTVAATSTWFGTPVAGQILAFLNGQNTYVATTTFSSPLLYSAGNVTCQTATGSVPGCLSAADWTTFNGKGAGTVTAVTGTYPIISSGGATPIISTGFGTSSTIGIGNNLFLYTNANGVIVGAASSSLAIPSTGLANTTVTAGSYTNTNLTVNAEGQITAASNGSASGGLTVDPNWNYFQNATFNNFIAPTSTTVGIAIAASSTIGNGSVTGGLTINGTGTTSNLIVTSASSAGCAQFSAQGLISSTGVACGSGGGGTWPFTPAINNAQAVQATTTALWFQALPYALMASGTIDVSGTLGSYAIDEQTVLQASSTNKTTAVGQGALSRYINQSATAGETAVGYQALGNATSSSDDTAVGYQALKSSAILLSGGGNSAFGWTALTLNSTGANESAFGNVALSKNTTGGSNSAFGSNALANNTTGASNVAMGFNAKGANTTGGNNVALGIAADAVATTSSGDTIVGAQAGHNISGATGFVGADNTFFGFQSGNGVTLGSRNVLFGPSTIAASMAQVTTGSNNISIGNDVAVASPTASNQLDIGNFIYGTGLSSTGSTVSNAFIGLGTTSPFALLSLTGSAGGTSNLFAISTSTSGFATTTALTIDQNGNLSLLNGGSLSVSGGLTVTPPGNPITSFIVSALGNIGAGINTLVGTNFFTIATTSANAFSIQDGYGTQVLNTATASTTGSIFTVAATTSPSLTSAIKLFDVDQYGHFTASSTGATPTISTCGTGAPVMNANANDATGSFTTGTSASACTITFAHAYATTPIVVISDSNTSAVADISSISTTAFTVSLASALSAVTVYYIVVQP